MNPEEQGVMLSAYFDGELDEEQRVEVEKMLQDDPELAEELGGMKDMGLALNSALDDEAANVDFASMREAVLREMSDIAPTVANVTPKLPQKQQVGFLEMFRAFFERPVVAFALGLLVAGVWTSYSPLVQNPTDSNPASVTEALTAENLPTARMRAPEGEQSFSKASPSLVLETLSVEKGKVVLDQQANDPDAPVVLWHFSESGGDSGEQKLPSDPAADPINEGDPL